MFSPGYCGRSLEVDISGPDGATPLVVHHLSIAVDKFGEIIGELVASAPRSAPEASGNPSGKAARDGMYPPSLTLDPE